MRDSSCRKVDSADRLNFGTTMLATISGRLSRRLPMKIRWILSLDFFLSDDGGVAPEKESGLTHGFHKGQNEQGAWKPVKNLAGGQKGRHYEGYGWFRKEFELPESANGQETCQLRKPHPLAVLAQAQRD